MQHPFIQPGGMTLKRQPPFTTRRVSPIPRANLALWLRSDAGLGIADAAAVATWGGKSPAALSATQATGGNRPAFDAVDPAFNNRPAVDFTTNDFLTLGLASALDWDGRTDDVTFFMVVNAAAGNTGTLFSKADATTRQYQFFIDGSDKLVVRWGTGAGQQASTADVTGGAKIVLITNESSGPTFEARFDGGAAQLSGTTVFVDASSFDTLVGARRDTNNTDTDNELADADIAEVIAYNSLLSDSQINQVGRYLAARYGLSWTAVS